jgi:hypothetical protein
MERHNLTLTLNYADMTVVESALVDFLEDARRNVTNLQSNGGEKNSQRNILLEIYTNRIKKAKYILSEIGTVLAEPTVAEWYGDNPYIFDPNSITQGFVSPKTLDRLKEL